MQKRILSGILWVAILVISFSGCSSIDQYASQFMGKAPIQTPFIVTASPLPVLSTATVNPLSSTTTPDSALVLTLWISPELNPSASTPSGKLIKQRLLDFEEQNPNVKVKVRIKDLDGPKGMLDRLTITRSTAPLASPSVALLNYLDLESAARQGLIYPLENLPGLSDTSDWYSYSLSMGKIDQKWYGVPISGDALVLVGQSTESDTPGTSKTWAEIFSMNQPVFFPASDPNALVSQALYRSLSDDPDGSIEPEEVQENILNNVFSFYLQGTQRGVFPLSVTQYDNFDQTWFAYTNHQTNWVITWYSDYSSAKIPNSQVLPLPGINNNYKTFATGSLLILTDSNPRSQPYSLKLIDFLSESQFLSHLNKELGQLPTRSSALPIDANQNIPITLDQIARSSSLMPNSSFNQFFAQKLKDVVSQVIRFQLTPQEASKFIIEEMGKYKNK